MQTASVASRERSEGGYPVQRPRAGRGLSSIALITHSIRTAVHRVKAPTSSSRAHRKTPSGRLSRSRSAMPRVTLAVPLTRFARCGACFVGLPRTGRPFQSHPKTPHPSPADSFARDAHSVIPRTAPSRGLASLDTRDSARRSGFGPARHKHCYRGESDAPEKTKTNSDSRYRSSTGGSSRVSGPVYRARGRISRLSWVYSMAWAIQPLARLIAKMGV